MAHQTRRDRFYNNVVRFLLNPEAALWVRRGDDRIYDLEDDVRTGLQRLYKSARELRENYSRSKGEVIVTQLFMERSDIGQVIEAIGGVGEVLPELREAITDCHLIFKHFAEYSPLDREQLFSSEGIVTNIRSPHDLLLAMFYPELATQNGVLIEIPEWKDVERLRSWIAMRTWFFIMDWVAERQAVAEGGKKMRAFTVFMEQNVFSPPDSGRRRTVRFCYDEGFRFKRLLGDDESVQEGEYLSSIELSHRVIRVDERVIRVWYASRIKQLAAFYGRLQRRGAVLDHAAATLMFESEADFTTCFPLLKDLLLDGAELKQVGGQRLAPENPFSGGDRGGVFLSGVVHVPGEGGKIVDVEIECTHLARFVDGSASISLFNHKVYEVKRLVMPLGEERPSLWEVFFPADLYGSLDSDLVARMVKRALSAVATDYIDDDQHRAHTLIRDMIAEIRKDHSAFLKTKVSFAHHK